MSAVSHLVFRGSGSNALIDCHQMHKCNSICLCCGLLPGYFPQRLHSI